MRSANWIISSEGFIIWTVPPKSSWTLKSPFLAFFKIAWENFPPKSIKAISPFLEDVIKFVRLIGAVYLDRGFDASKNFILRLWKNLINDAETTFVDAKTLLQEYSLKNFKSLPVYKLISNTGPRHKPNFKVGVKLKNSSYIYAIGPSKKNAEQLAASELLKKINKNELAR